MKKAIGFHLGQRGDIVISSLCAKAFKESDTFKDYHLTLGIGPQYMDMLPLFYQHPYFDNFHIYNSYDNWPNNEDSNYLKNQKYDFIFNGKPEHLDPYWWKTKHLTEETCEMVGLKPPNNLQCVLNKWFSLDNKYKDCIAFAPFAGFYNKNSPKKLSLENATKLVSLLNKSGYLNIIQLGGLDEPTVLGCHKINADYFTAIRIMLSCKYLLHTDTGVSWIASAHSLPCLGLYSNCDYHSRIISLQPINPNAIYLDNVNVNNIHPELILEKLKLL
jgi:hypothetical protein